MLPEMKYTQKLRLGMPVFATDGKAGKIAKIITDPESRQPVYLALEIGRLPNRREVVLPVSLVRGVTAETVNLDITRQTLADFPDYEVTVVNGNYSKHKMYSRPHTNPVYLPPDNKGFMKIRQRSVPDQSVAVEKGMEVRDQSGLPVGKVEGVILDRGKRQGEYIVFRRNIFSPLQLIPAELVQEVRSNEVKLRIDWKIAEALPEFSK